MTHNVEHPSFEQLYKEDFRHQASSGLFAAFLCGPMIPFLPVSETATVYEAYGMRGSLLAFGATCALILLASVHLSKESAKKKLRNA